MAELENFLGKLNLFQPMIRKDSATAEWPPLQFRIYASTNSRANENYGKIIHQIAFLDIDEIMEREVSFELPKSLNY